MLPKRKVTSVLGHMRPGAVRSALTASPPTLTTHKVLTAITNNGHSARSGSVILLQCHRQPPPLMPYQAASAALTDRSVTINQGSLWSSSHLTSNVQHKRAFPLKQNTSPIHCGLPSLSRPARGR